MLLDINFFEVFEGRPLILSSEKEFSKLQQAAENDTAVLEQSGIVDYSLVVIAPEINLHKSTDDNEENV